jgi:hypothetical protein
MSSKEPLYEDKLVRLTGESIILKRYYLPFGFAARKVPLADISQWYEFDPVRSGGGMRIWGTGDFRTWFPFDLGRPRRKNIYLLTLKERRRRIGFTVQDEDAFRAALRRIDLQPSIPPADFR